MQIPREMVLEQLRSRGDYEATERAEQELPEKLDSDEHRELLERYGVDPNEFEEDFGGQSPAVG
jgi:F0F1-type ATP synthase membrane subunit b/b'